MNNDILQPKPIYFSDHFNITKLRLKELGTFNPILNFDTKLFVDPTLLKTSQNPIIQKSRERYAEFFKRLLKLLKYSKAVNDKCWRAAKKMVYFPEFKYTCIGYGSDSINGSGSGTELNDKIFQSAIEIVEAAQGDPDIFLLLPLLEAGIGADRISDMTQNIIDDDICRYTTWAMEVVGLQGNCTYTTRTQNQYRLIKNPFSNCPLKLLPIDILADLPLSETFDRWLIEEGEKNELLREKINADIGYSWFEATKKEKKESLLEKLKQDKSFFMEVLTALKNSDFDHYDIESDAQGLHRWLKDSALFIDQLMPAPVGQIEDTLNAILDAVQELTHHFKDIIETKSLKGLFWTKIGASFKHVKETYSQMLFYVVCHTWLSSQGSNIKLSYGMNHKTKQVNFTFTVSGINTVLVQIKHSDNYRGLQASFEKHVEYVQNTPNTKGVLVVMNFDNNDSNQLTQVKKRKYVDCELIEVAVQNTENRETFSFDSTAESFETAFDDMVIEFEGVNWEFDENYFTEKQKGGIARHKKTTIIKKHIIKPMFLNTTLIKGKSIKQRAEHLSDELAKLCALSDEQLSRFSEKFELNPEHVKNTKLYFSEDKSEQIYKWCLAISKE